MTIAPRRPCANRKAESAKALPKPIAFRPRLEAFEDRCLLSGDMVLFWNAVALNAEVVDHTPGAGVPGAGLGVNAGPVRSARALAIMHTAIFDAVNALDGSCAPYVFQGKVKFDASMDAAAAEAGHDTLVALYPEQKASFDAALAQSLHGIDHKALKRGVQLGRKAAHQVLQARAHDGDAVNDPYIPGTGPGVWRTDPFHPTQNAYAPDYGNVKPFGIQSGTQFQVAPPPALNSPEYAAAFNEVKSLGGDGITTPTDRTPEQTEIGIYWGYDGAPGLGVPPRLYNQIARTVAVQQGNSEVENARLFALVNVAMADAGVTSWNTKYAYDFWRPVTAIREADPAPTTNDPGAATPLPGDGNPNTVADPNWRPLGAPASNPQLSANPNNPPTNFTPPFPAYTSGHATFGAALFRTLANFYGTDNVPFTFTSDELNGVTKDASGATRPLSPRSFTSFSQAAEENGQSRIYLGIHWSFDKTQGIAQGNAIADYVFEHMMTPLGHHAAAFGASGGATGGGQLPAPRGARPGGIAVGGATAEAASLASEFSPGFLNFVGVTGATNTNVSAQPATGRQTNSDRVAVKPAKSAADPVKLDKLQNDAKDADHTVGSLDLLTGVTALGV